MKSNEGLTHREVVHLLFAGHELTSSVEVWGRHMLYDVTREGSYLAVRLTEFEDARRIRTRMIATLCRSTDLEFIAKTFLEHAGPQVIVCPRPLPGAEFPQLGGGGGGGGGAMMIRAVHR